MRHNRLPVAAVLATMAVLGPGAAAGEPAADGAERAAYCSSATVISDAPDGVVIRFQTDEAVAPGSAEPARAFASMNANVPVVAYSTAPGSRGGGWRAVSSGPSRFAVLVRIADEGSIRTEVTDVTFRPLEAGGLCAVPDPEARPRGLVEVSEPAIVRGVRVVSVTVSPFARQPTDGVVASSVTVRLAAAPGPGANERTRRRPPASSAFQRILGHSVINEPPDGGPVAALPTRDSPREGAEYLVIVPDDFAEAVLPLVEWKRSKGLTCRVAMLSETGPTSQAIRSFIEDAYFEWDVPPEYVLLAGDSERIPVHEGLTPTDNFYGAVDGADYLADILVGRIPAETREQCAYLAAKSVAYERADGPTDAHWPASASLFLHEDGDYSDLVYYANTEFVRALMDSAGFAPIDTLFAGPTGAGVTQAQVQEVMNEGRGFINYRGSAYAVWPAPFAVYPPNLTNGWNQPVVISATCATVGYSADHYLSHTLTRAGSIDDPKGAVAFVGTTTSGFGLDLKRGYVDEAFFEDAFGEGRTLGEALAVGKLNLFTLDEDHEEYEGWTIIGDPELNLWTGPREELQVSHDDKVQAGPCDLVVRVSADGRPVEGARATCTLAPEVAVSALTGASGRAVLSFETSSAGTLDIVVTARNAAPYRGGVEVIDGGPFLAPWSLAVDDIEGNDDGLLSPGERASIELSLTNTGDEPAAGAIAILRSDDPHVTVFDSVAVYGGVPVGATAAPDRAYAIDVDAQRRSDLPIDLAVRIEYGEWTRLSYIPPIAVSAGRLVLAASAFDDRAPGGNGDGRADPGETGALRLELRNAGDCGLASIEAALATDDVTAAVIEGEGRYADAPPGSLVANGDQPFVVTISPRAPTSETAAFALAITARGDTYDYADTLDVSLTVVEHPTTLATGPDAYGYYAYDSSDTGYITHPVYDWIDIAPPGPGQYIRYVSTGDDRMKLETLPFAFTYYGSLESYISIGSNGVLAFGADDYVFGDNTPIPDLDGPASMVAPFWDDLNPALGGDVYAWHDHEGHRYVIQYEGVLRADGGASETFEIILLDPAYYTTPTGDGEIIFQYESVEDADGCTVGIEDREQDDGVEYAFDGDYDDHASVLSDGLAVLFTTEPPASAPAPWLVVRSAALDDSVHGNGNGRAEPGEIVSLAFGLANLGTADATDLSLALTAEDSTVTVVDGAAAIDDIPAGGSGTNADDPFSVMISSSASEGRATFWVTLGGPAGHSQSALRYDLDIANPGADIRSLALSPCHPNPSRDGTAMRIDLPGGDRGSYRVLVRVYNVAGRLVATPFDGELSPGSHQITWDGRGDDGARAASGVYFLRADAAGATRIRKAVILR